MKAIIHDFYTDIFPTDDEVQELCRPGAGSDTCSWLMVGEGGWECCCLHKPHSLLVRHLNGEMVAMRDGCDKVHNFSPMELGLGVHYF